MVISSAVTLSTATNAGGFRERWDAFRRYKFQRVKIIETPDSIFFSASAFESSVRTYIMIAVLFVLILPIFGLSIFIASWFVPLGGSSGTDIWVSALVFIVLMSFLASFLASRKTLMIERGHIVLKTRSWHFFKRAQAIPLAEIRGIVADAEGIIVWHGPHAIRAMNPGGYERSATLREGIVVATSLLNPAFDFS